MQKVRSVALVATTLVVVLGWQGFASAEGDEPTGDTPPVTEAAPSTTSTTTTGPAPAPLNSSIAQVSFDSCDDAAAAGYHDMRRGQPGYSSRLDRDGDGVACETDSGIPAYGPQNPGTVPSSTTSTTASTTSTTTTAPAPPAVVAAATAQSCDPNYAGACVPISSSNTINCDDVAGTDFQVVGVDIYRLDEGGIPGIACESNSSGSSGASVTSTSGSSPALAQTGSNSVPMALGAGLVVVLGLLAFLARERLGDVHYIVIRSKTGSTLLVPKARRWQ